MGQGCKKVKREEYRSERELCEVCGMREVWRREREMQRARDAERREGEREKEIGKRL